MVDLLPVLTFTDLLLLADTGLEGDLLNICLVIDLEEDLSKTCLVIDLEGDLLNTCLVTDLEGDLIINLLVIDLEEDDLDVADLGLDSFFLSNLLGDNDLLTCFCCEPSFINFNDLSLGFS